MQISLWVSVFVSSWFKLLSLMVVLLILKRSLHTVSCLPSCIFTNSTKFLFCHILANRYFLSLILAILTGLRWYLIIILMCIFWWVVIFSTFLNLIGHLLHLLEKCVFRSSVPFKSWIVVFLLLSCVEFFCYVLDGNPTNLYDLQIFFPFCRLFYFVNSCLCYTRVFDFNSPLVIVILAFTFVKIQKFIIKTNVKDLLLCFPLTVVWFQVLTSVFHSPWGDACVCCKMVVSLPFFCLWLSGFNTTYCEETVFSLLCPLGSFVINELTLYRVFISELCSILLTCVRVIRQYYFCFDYSTFVMPFGIRKCDASSLILSLKIALAIQNSLWSPANFRTVCSMSVKMYFIVLLNTAIFS